MSIHDCMLLECNSICKNCCTLLCFLNTLLFRSGGTREVVATITFCWSGDWSLRMSIHDCMLLECNSICKNCCTLLCFLNTLLFRSGGTREVVATEAFCWSGDWSLRVSVLKSQLFQGFCVLENQFAFFAKWFPLLVILIVTLRVTSFFVGDAANRRIIFDDWLLDNN